MAKYYISSIILAIEELHNENTIYRDLKPENIIVNSDGRVVLIDLGIAKVLDTETGFRTFTVIGTPHYMAPELSSSKGYSLEVDYWAVGVILY